MAGLYEYGVDPNEIKGLVSIIKTPVPLYQSGKKKGMPVKEGFKDLMAAKADARSRLIQIIKANPLGRFTGLRELIQ